MKKQLKLLKSKKDLRLGLFYFEYNFNSCIQSGTSFKSLSYMSAQTQVKVFGSN